MGLVQRFRFKGRSAALMLGGFCNGFVHVSCRINRGFYRFGETILELNIINHKLMARTEAHAACAAEQSQGKHQSEKKFFWFYFQV